MGYVGFLAKRKLKKGNYAKKYSFIELSFLILSRNGGFNAYRN